MEKKWSRFWNSSTQKRKQRKYVFQAPMHVKHRFMGSCLSAEIRKEWNIRTVPVRKGDTVTVLRGDNKGKSGKVTKTSLARTRIFVEGVETARADGSKALYPVHPSNVMITKLDLSDVKRKEKLERIKN